MDKEIKFVNGKLVKVKKPKEEIKEEIVETETEPAEMQIDTRTIEEKIIEEALRRLGL